MSTMICKLNNRKILFLESFLKSYEFNSIKEILKKNIDQYILNKIRNSELTDIFKEEMLTEKQIRKELEYFSAKGNYPNLEKEKHFIGKYWLRYFIILFVVTGWKDYLSKL